MEPVLFGYPITLLFLYFVLYSFLGWALETTYCSIAERRFVARGFLLGPICPIYGAGVLVMILFFTPLKDSPILFYVVSVVTMSAWEYFVGWLLEATTHVKYWDYSNYPLNIKGRVCLWVGLVWGLLSYFVVVWLHPPVAALVDRLPLWLRHTLAGGLFALVLTDAVTTVRELALTASLLARLERVSQELRLKAALGKAELSDRLDAAKDDLSDRLQSTKEELEKLRLRQKDLLSSAERHSRRFRNRYREMSSRRFPSVLKQVREHGSELAARLRQAREERRKNR